MSRTLVVIVVLGCLATSAAPAAIVNRQLQERGRSGAATPLSFARALFGNKDRVVDVEVEPDKDSKAKAAKDTNGNGDRRDKAVNFSFGARVTDVSRIATVLEVMTAFVLLGALVTLLVGIGQMLRGSRGGLELVGSGAFGLIGLIAAMTVIM